MTFIPFNDPQNLAETMLSETEFGPGLDGSTIPLWHASIGPRGEAGKEVIGVPVPEKEVIRYDTDRDRRETEDVSAYRRELFAANLTVEDYEGKEHPDALKRAVVEDLHEANVFSSALIDEDGERTGFHTIAIDIDHPVRLRETSPGRYHLMVDVAMPWVEYEAVLVTLMEAGVVEEGYYQASVEREATCLRLPWVHKVKPEEVDSIATFIQSPLDERILPAEPEGNTFPTQVPPELSWNAAEYDVEYVGGKGVLRRRKA